MKLEDISALNITGVVKDTELYGQGKNLDLSGRVFINVNFESCDLADINFSGA